MSLWVWSSQAVAQPFTDVSSQSGLDLNGNKGGVGWADFDGDGCLDVLVHTNAAWSDYSHLYRSDCAASPTFLDVTTTHAPDLGTVRANRTVVWGDFSGDGHPDFARTGPVEIWLNRGPTASPAYSFGTSAGAPTQQFTFWTHYIEFNVEGVGVIDYDGDGDLDLVIDNHDSGFVMLANDGAGTFSELLPAATGLPVNTPIDGDYLTVGDFDVDGDVDILGRKGTVADLWVNDGNGMFSAGPFDEVADNENKGAVSFCDFDNDGDFDIIWTAAPTTQIWRQEANGTFTPTGEPAASAGVVLPTTVSDASCGDIDNDGDLDLFVAADDYTRIFFNDDPQALTFREFSAGLSQNAESEGVNLIDYDNDGDLDIYATESGSDNELLRNDGNFPNYLVVVPRVALGGGVSRAAIGATVKLRDPEGANIGGVRQLEGGGGHGTAGNGGLRVHLGLPDGSDTTYALEVGFVGGGAVTRCVVPSDLVGYRLLDVVDSDGDDFAECPVSVAIAMPSDGSTISDPQPTLNGMATPGATVTVVINEGTADEETAEVTADASGDWSYAVQAALPVGTNTVDVTATGPLGQTATDSIDFARVADACSLPTVNCDENATCTSEDGAPVCTCDPGWTGDGATCTDVDECADGTHDCDENATCSNSAGGFDCTCNDGLFGNGQICTTEPGCQNGAVEGDEECDDGNQDETDACLSDCTQASCGDGFVWGGVEECDDGNDDDMDGCTSDCRVAGCGDGIVQSDEECDEGWWANDDEASNTCRTDCTSPRCGDGVIDGDEVCDDGPMGSDTCTAECKLPSGPDDESDASGPSGTGTDDVTPQEGCGCSATGGELDAGWLLLLAGLALVRRRR